LSRRLAALLLALALAAVVDRLYVRESGELTQQSAANLHFAQRPTWAAALARYPVQRPPLYPALLRGWRAAGLPPMRMGEVLALGTLALLFACARRMGLSMPLTVALLLLWSVAHFAYVNLYQPAAEALVAPLSLGLLLALARYAETPTLGALAAATALTAALLASRYFALFSVLPVTVAVILLVPAPRRLARAAAGAAVALAPVGLWMLRAREITGYWTGASRDAPRHFPLAVAHWSELTTLGGNLRLLVKTVAIDFLSTTAAAALAVVTQPYAWSALEMVTAALVLACACVLVAAAVRTARPPIRVDAVTIGAALLAVYLGALVVVWTLGNNDPLHTRFLYPAYPLLLLLAFRGYAALDGRWPRLPFQLLFALLLAVQATRSWLAVPLPIRYETDVEAAAEQRVTPGEDTSPAPRRPDRPRRQRKH
jgi:hypothetical protein